MTILIVDDNTENLYQLQALLAGNGYEIVTAANGAEALAKARQSPPDLIITDILMPVMDGFSLCREWRKDERLKSIPLVFYTATYTDSRDEVFALGLGATRFIAKPQEAEALVQAIREVIANQQTGNLKIPVPSVVEEPAYLKQYNEVLIRKLESKMEQLEQVNRELERDIAERKQVLAAVQESEGRFRSLVEAAPEGILVQSEGRIVFVNPAMLTLLRASRSEDLLGIDFTRLVAPEYLEIIRERIRLQRETGKPAPLMEQEYLRLDGSRVPVESTAVAVQFQGRDARLVFIRDITARKLADQERASLQAQLVQSQKLEAIGTLAAGVAHEVNNPVMGVIGYAQLIRDRLHDDTTVQGYVTEIIKATDRVATIVKNLLAFARNDKQAHSPANIADIVTSTLALIRAVMRIDQITLAVDVPDGLPKLSCRTQQIQQVIMNLVTNARDALNARYPKYDPNKTILIKALKFEKDGQVWIRTTVEDHGTGIPPEIRDHILDPFFTTKPKDKGTGLGLSISYSIVKDHGGNLWFETEVGSHTRFHMDLPAIEG